jgi:MIP family channel proteins
MNPEALLYSSLQKAIAEFLGTCALVFFGAGALCADQFLRGSGQAGLGILGIALVPGLIAAVMFASLGRVSGGHFNPALTMGFWVTRRLTTLDMLFYWAAQLAGAGAAAYALRQIPFDVWSAVQMGTPALASGISRTNGMVLEGLMTFFLMFVFFAAATDKKSPISASAGFAIGMTMTVGILVGGPFTGAAMNPARAFGPALAANHWTNQGLYWIGPMAGGVLGGWLYDKLFLRD